MEGKKHYERVIGGTEEEKEAVLKELQAVFEERNTRFAQYELEKNSEDLAIIERTEQIVDKMVADYGGNPKELPLDHIYILKSGSVSAMTHGRLAGGIHQPLGLNIGIEKGESKLLFASTLAHEMFHLKSYKSARVGVSGEDVRLYRSGMSMIDRKNTNVESGDEKEYFGTMEEAIVAECAKKFLDTIGNEDMFSKETEAIKTLKDWIVGYYRRSGVPEEKIKEFERELRYISNPQEKVERVLAFSNDEGKRQAYAAGMFATLYEKGEAEATERFVERKKLYELLDRLVADSGGTFKNRDEAFDEFAKANFSGNYLPLARTVERILGKGSFRKLAEEFSTESKKESEGAPEAESHS